MGLALKQSFFLRDADVVARDLLGCILRTRVGGVVTAGRVVETEAYMGPDDAAAHSYGGRRTRRNEAMYGPPGTAYVYFIYGMHFCFNAVTGAENFPAAVLIRALEPTLGFAAMRQRRGQQDLRLLCSGPARVCQALGIDGSVDGLLLPGEIVCLERGEKVADVEVGPRVGISRAVEAPLRFWRCGSPFVSRSRTSRREKKGRNE